MNNINKLSGIIKEAVCAYSEKDSSITNGEWLQSYLGEKLPEEAIEKIKILSDEIIDTIDIMEEKQTVMEKAVENGISAENWFASDIMKEPESNCIKARKVAEFFSGIAEAQSSYSETSDIEYLDVSENAEEWNDYKLKDTLKTLAVEAGKTGIKEIAADVCLKASEEGISAVFEDKEFVTDVIANGVHKGIKVAVSAGLTIAEQTGIIPPTTFNTLATVAHKTVEDFSVINDVIKGKSTITEALVKIKNTAVSTFRGMWQQHKKSIKKEIVETVGYTFGVKGAVVAGTINGLLTEKSEGSKLKNVLYEIGKSTIGFITQKISKIPILNKLF